MDGLLNSILTSEKASRWLGRQFHDLLQLSRYRNGWLNFARFGVKFPNCVTMPINRLSSEIFYGQAYPELLLSCPDQQLLSRLNP